MRGEDSFADFLTLLTSGSPPHARGRRAVSILPRNAEGITPACAGKTEVEGHCGCSCRDHPRMRGEDFLANVSTRPPPGSPPHARGRRRRSSRVPPSGRITPACAGKTLPGVSLRGSPKDHPRMRGEDTTEQAAEWRASGSPPHARGRPYYRTVPQKRAGITPACAGKTASSTRTSLDGPDHPRMRGEDWVLDPIRLDVFGSPPHAWGRLQLRLRLDVAHRITPACAGKTSQTTAQRP